MTLSTLKIFDFYIPFNFKICFKNTLGDSSSKGYRRDSNPKTQLSTVYQYPKLEEITGK